MLTGLVKELVGGKPSQRRCHNHNSKKLAPMSFCFKVSVIVFISTTGGGGVCGADSIAIFCLLHGKVAVVEKKTT